MKNFILRKLREYPSLYKLYLSLRDKRPLTFHGWGMTTSSTNPPWVFDNDFIQEDSTGFREVDFQLRKKIIEKKFVLSQFNNSSEDHLDRLMWRHYFVYWSASYALKNTNNKTKVLVECGVCDGLTISYAIGAAKNNASNYKGYLYDAWEGMRDDLLTDSEKGMATEYSYLQIEETKKNLRESENNLIYNQGFIPESFQFSENPRQVSWLHIDLNSSIATEAALIFFYDSLESGGIIIFDDYGWIGYEKTRSLVDNFFFKKDDSNLIHLPTGQALVFKK